MGKPKIVLISETFPPDLCGVADYVAIVARELATRYEVSVITRAVDRSIVSDRDGFRLYQVMDSRGYIFAVIRLLKQIQPDLVDIQLAYSAASRFNQFNLVSVFSSCLIRLLLTTKVVCTVHELSSRLGTQSHIRQWYRQLRDYLNTRGVDYFCCVDRRFLDYFPHARKGELPNFSNIPSLVHKNHVESRTFLYFGTIQPHKNIEHLFALFQQLRAINPTYKLLIVGGIVDHYRSVFLQRLQQIETIGIEYLGYCDLEALKPIVAQCSYAIFPFSVTDRNASVLAMLVNGLVVVAAAQTETRYQQFPNFFSASELTADFVDRVVNSTLKQAIRHPANEALIASHIDKRCFYYQQVLNDVSLNPASL